MLHGAGVAGTNGAALLCGTSGAGKSTLTGLLRRQRPRARHRRLCPDRGRHAPALAGPVRAQRQGRQLAGAGPTLSGHRHTPTVRTPARRQRYLAAARAGRRCRSPCAACLPALCAGSTAGADRATAGRGAGALRTQRRLVRELARRAWPSWSTGSTECPAYALSYGDAQSAVATVRRLIAGLGPCSPFDLLCGLISVALGQRTADSDLAAAVAATDVPWPRLVTLSGVHLLTPALAPALRPIGRFAAAVPPELRRLSGRDARGGDTAQRGASVPARAGGRAPERVRHRAGGAQGCHPPDRRPLARSGAPVHARPRPAGARDSARRRAPRPWRSSAGGSSPAGRGEASIIWP